MKIFYRWMIAIVIVTGLMTAGNIAEAYNCKWVNGYWYNGYYHHAHKVCWRNNNNYRHCFWRNGYKICN